MNGIRCLGIQGPRADAKLMPIVKSLKSLISGSFCAVSADGVAAPPRFPAAKARSLAASRLAASTIRLGIRFGWSGHARGHRLHIRCQRV